MCKQLDTCLVPCHVTATCLTLQHITKAVSAQMQGFPGNLTAVVTYLLTDNNEMQITIEATTDAPTPVNLAQHTYFNLNGVNSTSTILNHYAQIDG